MWLYTNGDRCEFSSSDSSSEYDAESVNWTGAADVAAYKMKCTELEQLQSNGFF